MPKRPKLDPALKPEQAARATAVAEVLGSRLAWDAVLRDVSRVLPGDVWLNELTATVPKPMGDASQLPPPRPPPSTTTAAPTTLPAARRRPDRRVDQGLHLHAGRCRRAARSAGTVPSLTNVQLESTDRKESDDKNKTVIEFTILADLSESGGAEVSKLLSSKAGVVAVAAGTAAVIVAAAGWFLLVKPKRAEAKKLDASIASVEQSIAARRAELARPKAEIRVRPERSVPPVEGASRNPDIAGVMLEVNRLAGLHGITFRSIRSEAHVPANAYMVHPFEVVLEGRFRNVSAFLGDLRKLVRVKKDVLDVRGRLFAVDTLATEQPDGKKTFPTVKATVTLDAFEFSGTGRERRPRATTDGLADATTQTSPATGATTAAGATP